MHTLEIRAVGSSSGAVFPKELLAQPGVKQGATLFATQAPDDGVRNPPLLDGNQRTALHGAPTFLSIKGAPVSPPSTHGVEVTVRLAEGSLGEQAFAQWLRDPPAH